jgi:hypothetical protein
MNKGKLLYKALLLSSLIMLLALALAGTEHCWRQNIDRAVSPSMDTTNLVPDPNKAHTLLGLIGATVTYNGFEDYTYYCDDGASGSAKNYFDLIDTRTNTIKRTNSYHGTSGPATGGGIYCSRIVDGVETICFNTSTGYSPAKGSCNQSSIRVGMGTTESLSYVFNTPGTYDLNLRLGTISPANDSPYATNITHRTIISRTFKIGTPSLLVFSQEGVKIINSFETDGMITQQVLFTLLNKSPFTEKVESYNMTCTEGITCEAEPGYAGFTISPNNAMIIPGTIIIDKSKSPQSFAFDLKVRFSLKNYPYSLNGLLGCDSSNICSTTSSPVVIKSGILDQQDFQVEVSNVSSNKFCVAPDGTIGRTGEIVAPKANVYFGGNLPPSAPNVENPLITMDECSPLNWETGLENKNAVFCTQGEFFVQLAKRISKASAIRTEIKNLQSNNDYTPALGQQINALLLKEGKLLGFTAYLRKQNLSPTSKNASLNKVQATLDDIIFNNLGLDSDNGTATIFGNDNTRFINLINATSFFRVEGNQKTEEKEIEPGAYWVSIDMNEIAVINTPDSYLFPNASSAEVNPSIRLEVSLKKIAPPKYDWFFYYDDNAMAFINTLNENESPSKYVANVFARGAIMKYEKDGENNFFYNTYAIPLVLKIDDNGHSGKADANYTVQNYYTVNDATNWAYDAFAYWTGFASTINQGCDTTSTSPIVESTLPVAIPDINSGFVLNMQNSRVYDIPELKTVTPGSVMYLQTVIYTPSIRSIQAIEPNLTKIITRGNKIHTDTNACIVDGNNCYIELRQVNSKYIVNADNTTKIKDLFNGIKNESICVYKETGLGNPIWNIYWNEQKILSDLNAYKETITDATICEE